jgi:hypothetical protein
MCQISKNTNPVIIFHDPVFKEACRQTVMLSKFVLLVSKAPSYEDIFANRDEEILKEKCRD